MRKGLGKFMMQILELVAFTNHMRKVVLTVLKHNKYNYFFKALKYVKIYFNASISLILHIFFQLSIRRIFTIG